MEGEEGDGDRDEDPLFRARGFVQWMYRVLVYGLRNVDRFSSSLKRINSEDLYYEYLSCCRNKAKDLKISL